MDIKLSILFLLISTIVGLSHLSGVDFGQMKRDFGRKNANSGTPRRRWS